MVTRRVGPGRWRTLRRSSSNNFAPARSQISVPRWPPPCRGVSFTEEQQREGRIDYNYSREAAWEVRSDEGITSRMGGNPVADNAAVTGTDVATYTRERPGMSAFVLEEGAVYHTYSAFLALFPGYASRRSFVPEVASRSFVSPSAKEPSVLGCWLDSFHSFENSRSLRRRS